MNIASDANDARRSRTYTKKLASQKVTHAVSKAKSDIQEDGLNAEESKANKYTIPQPEGAAGPWISIVNDPNLYFDWWWQKLSFPARGQSLDWVKPPEDAPQTKPRYKTYVRRLLPLCDPSIVGAMKYILVCHAWPFQLDDGRPNDNWRNGILRLWGSGRYKFETIDYYASRTIAVCEVEIQAWADFPPVLNMDTLLLDAKENRTWIQIWRQRGQKFPGDKGYEDSLKKGEDDLATSEMGGIILDLAKRGLEPKESDESGLDKGLVAEVVKDALKNRGGGIDPTQMMTAFTGMATQIATTMSSSRNGEDKEQIREMVQRIEASYGGQIRQLESTIADLREQLRSAREELARSQRESSERQLEIIRLTAEANRPEDIFQSIERVNKMKEAMGISGNRPVRSAKEPEPSMMQEFLPMLQPFLPVMAHGLMKLMSPSETPQTVSQNQGQASQSANNPSPSPGQAAPQAQTQGRYRVVSSEVIEAHAAKVSGQASSAPPPPSMNQPQAASEAPPSAQSHQATPPAPAPALRQYISPEGVQLLGEENAMALVNRHQMILGVLAEPLTRHLLDPELNGEDFASFVMNGWGDKLYNLGKATPVEEMADAIQAFEPIWREVRSVVSREKLLEFVERFVNAEKYFREEGEEGEELTEGEEKE